MDNTTARPLDRPVAATLTWCVAATSFSAVGLVFSLIAWWLSASSGDREGAAIMQVVVVALAGCTTIASLALQIAVGLAVIRLTTPESSAEEARETAL